MTFLDFIKFDVEGAEREALLGCREAVGRCAPDLQVALYHKSEDLFALPLLVRELRPTYRLFLRRFPSVPGWELNLFALEP